MLCPDLLVLWVPIAYANHASLVLGVAAKRRINEGYVSTVGVWICRDWQQQSRAWSADVRPCTVHK